MGDTALSIAKEITLAIIPKYNPGANDTSEIVGKYCGELFKAVLFKVIEGIKESNK